MEGHLSKRKDSLDDASPNCLCDARRFLYRRGGGAICGASMISRWKRKKQQLIGRKDALARWVQTRARSVDPYWPPAVMIAILVGCLILVRPQYDSWSSVRQGVYVEGWGTVLDLVLVGLLLTWFELRRGRKDSVERYLEEIDDFKRWDSEEARVENRRKYSPLGEVWKDRS